MGNSFSFADIPDLKGRNYVITGANTGIGLVTATQIAKRNGNICLACRSKEKAEKAIEAIRLELKPEQKDVKLEFLQCDLASLKSAEAAARELVARKQDIDVVVANAGIMMCPFSTTADGIETQFGVNHLGHFVFVGLLLPHLRRKGAGEGASPARLVVVSSVAHNMAPSQGLMAREKLEIPAGAAEGSKEYTDARAGMEKGYGPIAAYGHSKLCNVLYSKRVARKLGESGLQTLVLHPGYVDTELGRHVKSSYGAIANGLRHVSDAVFAKSPADGALTSLFAAVSAQALALPNGTYLVPTAKVAKPSAHALNEEQQEKLHAMSLEIVQSRLGSDVAAELKKNYGV